MEEKLGFVDTAWMVITENLELSTSSMDVIGMVVPTHFPDRETIHKQSCQTMGQLYTNTNYLMQKFKDNGYLVIEMWECEYDIGLK